MNHLIPKNNGIGKEVLTTKNRTLRNRKNFYFCESELQHHDNT